MNDFLYVDYFRAMLYLFSAYNVISVGIIHFRNRKRLFWIHLTVGGILLLNFLGVVSIRVFSIGWFDTLIFEYGMTLALIVLNIFVWGLLYSRSGIDTVRERANELLDELNIADLESNKKLDDIAKISNS